MLIYRIVNKINGKQYIGQTRRSIFSRWREHQLNSKANSILWKAIHKYGTENFEVKIICRCNSQEEMNHRERYCVRIFNSLSPIGYNLMEGGGPTGSPSLETRKRMSKSQLIRFKDPIERKSQKEKILNFKLQNPEYAKNISALLRKRYAQNPIANSERIAKAGGGKYFFAYDNKSGKLVWEGYSQVNCAKSLNLDQANISRCLSGTTFSHKGYSFSYNKLESFFYKRISKRRKKVICIDTGVIFESVTAAAIFAKCNRKNIARACRGERKTAGNFVWKYYGG